MPKIAQLSIPVEFQDFIGELNALSKNECRILKQTNLTGVETVVLITAIVQLTSTTIDLIAKYYNKKSKESKSVFPINIDGEQVIINSMNQDEIKIQLTNLIHKTTNDHK